MSSRCCSSLTFLIFLTGQSPWILGPAIQADLHLSNAQFGAIGTAFALLYAGLAISACLSRGPNQPERRCCRISLAVWSGFTALCGASTGFWSLFVFLIGVGVGEAGGVAPSYALIADYFLPEMSRSRTRHFFTGNPARIRKRSDHRCSPRRLVRLANRFCHHGCWRAGARPDPPRPRA